MHKLVTLGPSRGGGIDGASVFLTLFTPFEPANRPLASGSLRLPAFFFFCYWCCPPNTRSGCRPPSNSLLFVDLFCLPKRTFWLSVDPVKASDRLILHSLCPLIPFFPVGPVSVCKNARCSCPSTVSLLLSILQLTASCPSTHSLPANTLALVARRPNLCLCPSTHSLPEKIPGDPVFVSGHRIPQSIYPLTINRSGKTPTVEARRHFRFLCLIVFYYSGIYT